MSADGPGHGTGYEDAITRKIGAAEARAQAAEAALERERAQTAGLVEDNAKLRARAEQLERAARARGQGVVIAWTLCVLALLVAAALALLWTGEFVRFVRP
ncbi:MAG: hypothetical protein ABI960_10455 [Candidatus Eisenbacteria bacterium]